jgi:hypothetical protein
MQTWHNSRMLSSRGLCPLDERDEQGSKRQMDDQKEALVLLEQA